MDTEPPVHLLPRLCPFPDFSLGQVSRHCLPRAWEERKWPLHCYLFTFKKKLHPVEQTRKNIQKALSLWDTASRTVCSLAAGGEPSTPRPDALSRGQPVCPAGERLPTFRTSQEISQQETDGNVFFFPSECQLGSTPKLKKQRRKSSYCPCLGGTVSVLRCRHLALCWNCLRGSAWCHPMTGYAIQLRGMQGPGSSKRAIRTVVSAQWPIS